MNVEGECSVGGHTVLGIPFLDLVFCLNVKRTLWRRKTMIDECLPLIYLY
jgi:hypothetical protein